MKNFKYFVLIFLIVILTGCTGSYNLIVDDDKIKEEINFNMSIDEYVLYPFDNYVQYPLYRYSGEVYDVNVTNEAGIKKQVLSYSYSPRKFSDSNAINSCFENHSYVNSDDFYEFKLSGAFNCMYGDSFDINVITNNKVLFNNADSVNGNTYTWHVTSSNKDNLSIEIKIKKGSKFSFDIISGILIIMALIFGSFFVYKIFKGKYLNRNNF